MVLLEVDYLFSQINKIIKTLHVQGRAILSCALGANGSGVFLGAAGPGGGESCSRSD